MKVHLPRASFHHFRLLHFLEVETVCLVGGWAASGDGNKFLAALGRAVNGHNFAVAWSELLQDVCEIIPGVQHGIMIV